MTFKVGDEVIISEKAWNGLLQNQYLGYDTITNLILSSRRGKIYVSSYGRLSDTRIRVWFEPQSGWAEFDLKDVKLAQSRNLNELVKI